MNSRTGPGFCSVCRAPVEERYIRCFACEELSRSGQPLADQVVPLAYGGHNPQSKHLLRRYKCEALAASEGVKDLQATVLVLLYLGMDVHRECLTRTWGPWEAMTCVPSTRTGRTGVLREITEILSVAADVPSLDVSFDSPSAVGDRSFRPEGYDVALGSVPKGGHVLVLDDTWASGNRAQSVATMLKMRGAGTVTVLAAGRWLEPSWPPTRAFLDVSAGSPPYDPLICPVGFCDQ